MYQCKLIKATLTEVTMSLRASLKVPRYGLFYFKSDCTISVVPLKKIAKVISGDNVSRGSQVMLNYGSLQLVAEIIGVNGKYVYFPLNKFTDLLTQRW